VIQAHELRHPIELQSATKTVGGDGQRSSAWTTYAPVRAKIETLAGREFERAKAFGETVDHRITIRYRAGVTTDHRILFRGRAFLINAALNTEERNVELVLMTTEVVK
jgi:SPP1 family predicted phage head-tail adaptor